MVSVGTRLEPINPQNFTMHRVLVLGAGKIGRMIARLLMDSGDYDVTVGDVNDAALQRIFKLTGAKVKHLDAANPGE